MQYMIDYALLHSCSQTSMVALGNGRIGQSAISHVVKDIPTEKETVTTQGHKAMGKIVQILAHSQKENHAR